MAGGMARRAPSLDPCSCSSFSCHLLPPGPSSLARWADRAPPASCAVATLTAAAQDSSAVTRTDSSSAAAGGSSVLTRRPPGPPVIQSCEAASCGGRHPGRTTCLLAGALAAAGRPRRSLPRGAGPCNWPQRTSRRKAKAATGHDRAGRMRGKDRRKMLRWQKP
jgi:hypothetical protein